MYMPYRHTEHHNICMSENTYMRAVIMHITSYNTYKSAASDTSYNTYRSAVSIYIIQYVQKCREYTHHTISTEVPWLYTWYHHYRSAVRIHIIHAHANHLSYLSYKEDAYLRPIIQGYKEHARTTQGTRDLPYTDTTNTRTVRPIATPTSKQRTHAPANFWSGDARASIRSTPWPSHVPFFFFDMHTHHKSKYHMNHVSKG